MTPIPFIEKLGPLTDLPVWMKDISWSLDAKSVAIAPGAGTDRRFRR